jgi:hypothetical protein
MHSFTFACSPLNPAAGHIYPLRVRSVAPSTHPLIMLVSHWKGAPMPATIHSFHCIAMNTQRGCGSGFHGERGKRRGEARRRWTGRPSPVQLRLPRP